MGMEIITADRLSFRYPDEDRASLDGLSFSVEEGQFVVLCGPSGCGKTTLLRHLKRELTPVGTRSGSLLYRGRPLEELSPESAAGEIGLVFQNPDAQIVMDTVWHELAFSMENIGLPPAAMRSRLAEIAGVFGLEPLLYKSVHELSGGQKQMLNLASVLLLQPKLLLLDEPTSQLDPVAAKEFIHMLHRLNEEMSITVIISEHRLEEVLPMADQVLLLEEGKLKAKGSPREVVRSIEGEYAESHLAYLPMAARLYRGLSEAGTELREAPLTVREGKRWFQEWAQRSEDEKVMNPVAVKTGERVGKLVSPGDAEPLLSCREVTFRYEKEGPEVLKKLNLTLQRGECLAVMGGNGAGKSTLLQMIAGLTRPQRGQIKIAKGIKTAYLAQNPLLYFSQDSVLEELQHMARYAGLREPESGQTISSLVDSFLLRDILNHHPQDVSGGQQQKVALAMLLLLKPDILLLDEPTKGLDPAAKESFAALLLKLREQGASIIMVTHDVEFAAGYATRCAMLFDGGITSEGLPGSFFGANYFYTTAVNRMVRDWLPQALTLEDVMEQWPNSVYRS